MPSPEINAYLHKLSGRSDLAVSVHFSLFPAVQRARTDHLFLHQRAGMVTMSHEIEKQLEAASQPGILFSGFQLFSRFRPQAARYHRIAEQGHTVYIFGIADESPPEIPGVRFVPISERHALAREWFVIASAPEYFSALVAEELLELPTSQKTAQTGNAAFQGIWTFDEPLVADLVLQVREALGLHPGVLPVGTSRDYEKQLSAIAVSANNLIAQLEQRNQDLINQQQNYEDLVNMLVHDLRGSLTSVIGSLELIASDRYQTQDELQDLLNNSLLNSRRLSQMISDVLAVNKMEAGHFKLDREMVDARQLLHDVYNRWQVAARWETKQLSLMVAPDIPLFVADREIIERVLDNLISNAIKYGENIELAAGFSAGQVVITVADDGPGIPPGQAQAVFEKFSTAQSADVQRKGTGLGLTFSKMAIEAHGGRVEIETSQLGGAMFSIYLPLVPPKNPTEKNVTVEKRGS